MLHAYTSRNIVRNRRSNLFYFSHESYFYDFNFKRAECYFLSLILKTNRKTLHTDQVFTEILVKVKQIFQINFFLLVIQVHNAIVYFTRFFPIHVRAHVRSPHFQNKDVLFPSILSIEFNYSKRIRRNLLSPPSLLPTRKKERKEKREEENNKTIAKAYMSRRHGRQLFLISRNRRRRSLSFSSINSRSRPTIISTDEISEIHLERMTFRDILHFVFECRVASVRMHE